MKRAPLGKTEPEPMEEEGDSDEEEGNYKFLFIYFFNSLYKVQITENIFYILFLLILFCSNNLLRNTSDFILIFNY